MALQLLRPPRLRPGDTVGVIAPSGPVLDTQREHYVSGERVLRELGFQVRMGRTVGGRRWWSAGSPAELAADLNAMFADPQIRAIVAAVGGFSAMGVLDLLDYDLIRAHPKPFLGMSDITLYHLALYSRCGLVGFHADNLTHGLGEFLPRLDRGKREVLLGVYRALLTDARPVGRVAPLTTWEPWHPGRASGPLIGGDLKRVAALAGTPYFPPAEAFEGALFFWEEIGAPLHDILLNLHQLRHRGIFDRIAGMLVGKLWLPRAEYPRELEYPTPREAVLDVLGAYDFPILGELDFGHLTANIPLPIGVRAALDAGSGEFSLLEAAVQ